MCLNLVKTPIKKYGRTVGFRLVPCGKCPECLKSKQNAYIVKMYVAAEDYADLHFVTLTHNDESLPILHKNTETGEEEFIGNTQERQIIQENKKQKGEYEPYIVGNDTYCVSLNPDDVRRVMHSFRTYCKRHGIELKNFKYCIIGEYGPRTNRPHYHGMFYGLTDEQMALFQAFWSKRYGFCVPKRISATDVKSKANTAKYISKYMTKGIFECELVDYDMCKKPRVLTSSNFLVLSQQQIDWYTGADIVGSQFQPIPSYKDEDLDRIIARHKILIGNMYYPLGKQLKNKLFKYVRKDEQLNGQIKRRVLSTPLSKALTLRLQTQLADRYTRELEDLKNDETLVDLTSGEIIDQLRLNEMLVQQSKNEAILKNLKKFYQKSVF